MNFVYHIKPPDLFGSSLIPLNVLRSARPSAYDFAVKKYAGREHLKDARIPLLDCLWNDAVHLSPLHPCKLREALEPLFPDLPRDRVWLKIPVSALAGIDAVSFERPPSRDNDAYDFSNARVERVSISRYREIDRIPDATLAYYKERAANGERPLLFNGVRHILARGLVPLDEAEEMRW